MDYSTDEGVGSPSSSMASAPLDSDFSSNSDEDENILFDLIRKQRWDDAMARMKTEEGRRELRRMGRYGKLPLHEACYYGAPLEFVEAMLEEYPEAVKVTDNIGRLPLHLACSVDPELSLQRVVRLILDAYPEGSKATDINLELPLHAAAKCGASLEVVRLLLEANPDGAQATDDDGCLPLHYAFARAPWLGGASPEVVRVLLDANAEGAQTTDEEDKLPLHSAAKCNASLQVLQVLLEAHPQGATTRDGDVRLPIHLLAEKASPAKEDDVSKVDLLLKPVLRDDGAFNATGSYDGEGRHPLQIAAEFGLSRVLEGVPIVHACLRTKYDCPPNTIHHVVMRHPGQLRHAHEGGNYPLHVAAANRNLNGVRVEVDADPDPDQGKRKRESKDLIALLVESYPEAAGHRNDNGRLPLSLAIECGKPWEGGVEAIADAAKDVIAEKDDSTELYPFMIAAIGDHSCLSTVYRLLRHCPELKRYRID